jgi:cell wall assembly regulator SMI1
MATPITDLIKRLDKWLHENRPDYYAQLLPGATDQEIAELEQSLGLAIPPALASLLQWKNGQTTDTKLVDNWSLLSCASIIDCWQSLTEWQEDGSFEVENWWSRDWIPFLYDHSGNNCCIDATGHFSGKAGQILYYWHDDNSRKVTHENFDKWLETIVLAMEKGIVYYCQEDMDNEEYNDFVVENNPGYPLMLELDEEEA